MRYVCVLAAVLGFSTVMPAKPPVPRPAKDFTCTDAEGKSISISKYKGKVVVIQFLITNCTHCQALSQVLTKLQADYGSQGFQAFGVAFNDATPDMVRSYVKDHQLGIPVGYAARDSVIDYLGVSVMERLTVPQVMIIDREGRVQVQSDAGGTPSLQNEAYLRELIGGLLQPKTAYSKR
jgi:peroxiredoxin